jgi:hypothetical protein
MLDGYGQRYGIIEHIGYIEIVVAFRYYEQLVGVVIVILAILYCYVIGGVNRPFKVVKAAVTQKSDGAFYHKCHVVEVILVYNSKVDSKVGIVDVGALHIDKELLTEPILKSLSADRHAFQRQFIFSKLSHNAMCVEKTVQSYRNLSVLSTFASKKDAFAHNCCKDNTAKIVKLWLRVCLDLTIGIFIRNPGCFGHGIF